MKGRTLSRRVILKVSTGLALGAVFASPARAQAPPPETITSQLIDAANQEARVVLYSSMDLPVGEKLAKAFETKYPGIAVRVERSGAERVFQRIGQEYASNIHACDVVITTNPAHMLVWTADNLLTPYRTEDMAKHFPAEVVNADGLYATVCSWLGVVGYNTNLVKREDAPKSFADLLDPKWKGKMVKGHPSYSGAILTTTFVLARDLGWPYLEKLAQQRVMQVQSAADPPKKIAIGERAVQADGNDYSLVVMKAQGQPVEVVYPAEGSVLITVPSAVMQAAPNPNAARLFQNFMFSAEAQQLFVDAFAHRSFHTQVKEPPERTPLSAIKLLRSDPAAVEAQSEDIKARYAKIFGV